MVRCVLYISIFGDSHEMAGLRRIINSKFGRKVPDEGVGEYNLDYGSFRGYIEEDPTVIDDTVYIEISQ